MRKKIYLAASIVLAMSLMTACGTKTETTEATTEVVTEATTEEAEEPTTEEATAEDAAEATSADAVEWTFGEYGYNNVDNIVNAIDFFICDELAKGYDAGDVGIPIQIQVARDTSNPEDIKVWGCFWFETYSLKGDILENQAGGSYPGCMHLKESSDAQFGYEVTGFDLVEDGANFDSSAKEIFGDYYDDFMSVYSNDETYATERNKTLTSFVKANEVPATKYQDYGWDPVELNFGAIDYSVGEHYIGGLYAVDGESDINMAFFIVDGTSMVIVQEGEHYYYGTYTLEDVVLEDGTMYSNITVEDKTFGYNFDDEEGTSGIIIDQEGKSHKALKLDESVANDMMDATK